MNIVLSVTTTDKSGKTGYVRVQAPAKINLALHVTGQRDDGYHLLETLVVFAELADQITVSVADQDGLEISGPFARSLSNLNGNIVEKARDIFRAATGFHSPLAIVLEKNLPVAAGIGGGSSDAAATLKALKLLSHTDFGTEQLAVMGAKTGADVPMCVRAVPLIAQGIGDRIEPVADIPGFDILIINPGVEIATPVVFAALETKNNPPLPPVPVSSEFDEWCHWLNETRNDLRAPAEKISGKIGTVLDALRNSGAMFSQMSGSGATCFGLFRNPEDAQDAAATIAKSHPEWFIAVTRTQAAGVTDESD